MAYRKKQHLGLCISTAMCLMSSTLTLQAIPFHADTIIQLGNKESITSTALLSYFHRNNQSAFIAGQYQVNNNSWIASAGLGYRHLFGNQLVIGGYVFGDLLYTNDARKHYVLSPGLDIQTNTWHFNTNVYIPIGAKKLIASGQTHFEGHTATEQDHNIYEQSMLGVDTMLTYIPKTKYNIGIGIGGYHYRAKKGDIKQQSHLTGIKGQLAFQPFDRILLSGEYRYDKMNKSRYMFNIGLNISPGPQNISMNDKLNSTINRNMNLNTTEQGMALTEQTLVSSQVSNVYNNVHFVHDTLGSSAGTGEYGSPHSSLEEALAVSAGKDSPYIWLTEGYTYTTTASGDITVPAENTTIMGRSSNYQTATKGSDANAPVVAINNGGLRLSNGSHLEGFKLETVGSTPYGYGDGMETMNYGINNIAGNTVSIKDMIITSAVADNDTTIKNVTSILNYGTINFSGSNTMGAIVGLDQGDGYAYGILNFSENSSSNFTGAGTNIIKAKTSGDGYAFGINNQGTSSFDGGSNTITATTSGGGAKAYGIWNYYSDSISSFSGGGNNTITATTSGLGNAFAYGIRNEGTSNFDGGTNEITGTTLGNSSATAYGIYNESANSSSTFSGGGNNTIKGLALGNDNSYAFGIYNGSANSSTSFTGGGTNTITAEASGLGSALAYGIFNTVTDSSSSFSGAGTNEITATTAGTGSAVSIYNRGTSSFTDTGGGSNTITATASGDAYAVGIYNFGTNSISSFDGGTNNIKAEISSNYDVYGILNEGISSFIGAGTNTITSKVLDSTGYAYGIYNQGTSNFTNAATNEIHAIADVSHADPYNGYTPHAVTGGGFVTCKIGTTEHNLERVVCGFP